MSCQKGLGPPLYISHLITPCHPPNNKITSWQPSGDSKIISTCSVNMLRVVPRLYVVPKIARDKAAALICGGFHFQNLVRKVSIGMGGENERIFEKR